MPGPVACLAWIFNLIQTFHQTRSDSAHIADSKDESRRHISAVYKPTAQAVERQRLGGRGEAEEMSFECDGPGSWARLGFIPVLQSGLSSFAVGRFPFQPTKEVASFLRWAEKSPRLFSMDRWNLHKAGLKIAHEIPELAIGGIVQPAFSIDNLVEMTRWVASENEFVMN